jgi:hypothetical protein
LSCRRRDSPMRRVVTGTLETIPDIHRCRRSAAL